MNADSPIVTQPHQSPLRRLFHPIREECPAQAAPLLRRLANWDVTSARHSQRVGAACRSFGMFLSLSEDDLERLTLAGFLHDIGKLSTSRAILTKNGSLTDDEYQEIKNHSNAGADLLMEEGFSQDIVSITRYHHEWWNGRGYPEGLSGMEIPFESRVIGIVDAWDAISARRAYHRQRTDFLALSEIRSHAGTQFDPDLAPAFIDYSVQRLAEQKRVA